jgi:hypothetical protein
MIFQKSQPAKTGLEFRSSAPPGPLMHEEAGSVSNI